MITEYSNQVIDFLVWKQSIIFLRGEKLKDRTLYINQKPILNQAGDFFIHNDMLLVSTWDPTTYLIDLVSLETIMKFEGYSCSPRSLTNDGFLLSRKANGSREKFEFRFEDEELAPLKVKGSYLYEANDIKLKQFSEYEIVEEVNNWYFKTINPVFVNKVIGLYGNIIFLALSNSVLVALNSDDGKEIWSLNPSLKTNPQGIVQDSQTFNLRIDSQDGCLIHPLIKVERDGKVKQNNYLRKLETKNAGYWQIKGNVAFDFNKNYLVFSATKRNQKDTYAEILFECHIVVVDRLKDEIINQDQLNKNTDYKDLKKVVLNGEEIYILDYGGSLNMINLNKQII